MVSKERNRDGDDNQQLNENRRSFNKEGTGDAGPDSKK